MEVFDKYVKDLNKKQYKQKIEMEEKKVELVPGINSPQLKQDIAIQL